MKSFVNIQSVFADSNQRQLSVLSELYSNKQFLINTISAVSSHVLNEDVLQNKKVLLKPNWVRHNRKPYDEFCLCTHQNFLLAALHVVLKAKPQSVVIGDAPIQGCKWDELLSEIFLKEVHQLQQVHNIPVIIKDFRRVIFDPSKNDMSEITRPLTNYIIFDLGKKSYLEPISSSNKNNFRVTLYNPDRFTESHTAGVHKYCIAKDLFETDIVISIPKVKTHQKAGITAALKNIVGLNGDKDFLPHHRIGGTNMGGDCYPGGNRLRYLAELCLDNSNRNKGKKTYWFWLRLSSLFWKLSIPKNVHQLAAGWYGNDTTWRMVLDLNTIVNFGKADGSVGNVPQRSFYSLCDGIVGGQGDGPLDPEPLNLGMVSFTDNSAWNDICMGKLMGMDVNFVPLLTYAKKFMPEYMPDIFYNNKRVEVTDLKQFATQAKMPPGWTNYISVIK